MYPGLFPGNQKSFLYSRFLNVYQRYFVTIVHFLSIVGQYMDIQLVYVVLYQFHSTFHINFKADVHE